MDRYHIYEQADPMNLGLVNTANNFDEVRLVVAPMKRQAVVYDMKEKKQTYDLGLSWHKLNSGTIQ